MFGASRPANAALRILQQIGIRMSMDKFGRNTGSRRRQHGTKLRRRAHCRRAPGKIGRHAPPFLDSNKIQLCVFFENMLCYGYPTRSLLCGA
jgi:hypothetical protein